MPRPLSRWLSAVRPELTQLEDRTTPVAITTAGTFATLDLDTAGEVVTLSTDGTSVSVSTTASITLNGSPVSNPQSLTGLTNIVITDSAAGTGLTFANSTGGYNAVFTVALDNAPGQVTFNGSSNFGANSLNVTTARNILVNAGASLTSNSGNITLAANRQATPTGGDFVGVDVAGVLTTQTGLLSVAGTGGDAAGGLQYGVQVRGGGLVSSAGGGTVSVTGTGGVNGGNFNFGVWVTDAGSKIASGGGNLSVTGTGGGSGTSRGNFGVKVESGGQIAAGGTGTVTISGSGGNGTGSGDSNYGVIVTGSGSRVTSGGGAVTVSGTAGGGAASTNNVGVLVFFGGEVTAGGTAPVSVTGTGGPGVNANSGVRVESAGSQITSGGGAVSVTGTGGANSVAVDVVLGGLIGSGGNAAVSVVADGLVIDGSGSVNAGTGQVNLFPRTAGTRINLGGADVLTGNPLTLGITNAELDRVTGGTITIGDRLVANPITVSAAVSYAGDASLTLQTAGNIVVNAGASLTSTVGSLSLSGSGGANGVGVDVRGTISTVGGRLTVSGLGGTSGNSNRGVVVSGSGRITSASGGVNVTGTGGSGSGAGNDGVAVENGGAILGGSGATSVNGTTGGGAGNRGVLVDGPGSIITSTGGGVQVVGSSRYFLTGSPGGTVAVVVSSGGVISAGGAGTVSVNGGGGGPVGTPPADFGVVVTGANSAITSSVGGVSVYTLTSSSFGVEVLDGGAISAGGSGGVGVSGGLGGVKIAGGRVTALGGGQVSITSSYTNILNGSTTGGSVLIETGSQVVGIADVSITADSVDIDPTASVSGNIVTISPASTPGFFIFNYSGYPVYVGGSGTGSGLVLTDAELDRVTANTLVIGRTANVILTVSADITRPSATNLQLLSGGDIIVNGGIDTGGGTLLISPSSNFAYGVSFPKAGTDITATATSFAPGSTLRMNVAGSVADSQYDRLVATGTVDLTGTNLVLSGSYAPQPGESFVIVSADSVVGTFAGLPNGSIVSSGGGHFRLTYSPTAVTLTALPHPLVVTAVGSTVRVQDQATGTTRTFTPFAGFAGSVTVATVDLNGDSVLDIIVGAGAGGGPNVKVFDGASLAEVASIYAFDPSFSGGVFVAAGNGEIVVGAGAGGSPHVKVIDATKLGQTLANGQIADSALLASFYAYDPSFTGGVRVAVGDINGDGVPDVVTGAGAGGGPHVKVIDGTKLGQQLANGQIADSALSASFFAFDASFTGGVFVAATGGQIAVGADAGGGPNAKLFNQFSIETQSFYAYDQSFTGGVRVAFADVNNDGVLDLITGAGPGGGPHVKGFNIVPFTEVASFFAADPLDSRGVFV